MSPRNADDGPGLPEGSTDTMPTRPRRPEPWAEPVETGVLVLADGTVMRGQGLGATGEAVGEVCFNTAMTGYQEKDQLYFRVFTTNRSVWRRKMAK